VATTGTYCTDEEIKVKWTDVLLKHVDASALPDGADVSAADANQKACDEIHAKLQGRGYTKEQIDAWDRRREFNLDIAIYWCLNDYRGTEESDGWIRPYDRRKELETVAVLIGRRRVAPGDPTQEVGYGPTRNPNDIFDMDVQF
jgi:hypothetical protein